jgi:hypothetical protein
VIHDPHVYIVVWGRYYPNSLLSGLQHFVAGLHGSVFGAVLAEYYDTTGHVHNDITLAGTWTDPIAPPMSVTLGNIDTEIARATTAAKWPTNPNTILVLLLPDGSSFDDSCGNHGGALTPAPRSDPLADNAPPAWAVIAYPNQACWFDPNPIDDLTFVTSHELAEAITQPFNIGSESHSGWWGFTFNVIGTPPPLPQLADACEPTSSRLNLTDGGSALVSNIYDLIQSRCLSFG